MILVVTTNGIFVVDTSSYQAPISLMPCMRSMRSKGYELDICKNLLFLIAMMVILFVTDQLYSIADEDDNTSAWFLNNEDPEYDENFMMTLYEDTKLEEAEGEESEVF